jgi:hypothetical protein
VIRIKYRCKDDLGSGSVSHIAIPIGIWAIRLTRLLRSLKGYSRLWHLAPLGTGLAEAVATQLLTSALGANQTNKSTASSELSSLIRFQESGSRNVQHVLQE